MAVYAGDVPGEGSSGFAIAFAANTLILVVLWFRTGLHDPTHRPASTPYSIAYLAAAITFAVSAAVEEPLRYWLWGAGLATQALGVLVAFLRWVPRATREGRAVLPTTPSLVERLGLFVIIVLGEVVVGAVTGMAEVRDLGATGLVPGFLGVLVAIGLWWLYFDLASQRAPVPRFTQTWMYLHFPLVIAMGAGGAGVLNTIEHAAEPLPGEVRWLLVGSLAVAILSTAAITRVLEVRRRLVALYRTAGWTMLVSALLIVTVGLSGWGAKASLGAMVLLLLLPIVAGLAVWVKSGATADTWPD
jgi:low temperature requirement protein LtrA